MEGRGGLGPPKKIFSGVKNFNKIFRNVTAIYGVTLSYSNALKPLALVTGICAQSLYL